MGPHHMHELQRQHSLTSINCRPHQQQSSSPPLPLPLRHFDDSDTSSDSNNHLRHFVTPRYTLPSLEDGLSTRSLNPDPDVAVAVPTPAGLPSAMTAPKRRAQRGRPSGKHAQVPLEKKQFPCLWDNYAKSKPCEKVRFVASVFRFSLSWLLVAPTRSCFVAINCYCAP